MKATVSEPSSGAGDEASRPGSRCRRRSARRSRIAAKACAGWATPATQPEGERRRPRRPAARARARRRCAPPRPGPRPSRPGPGGGRPRATRRPGRSRAPRPGRRPPSRRPSALAESPATEPPSADANSPSTEAEAITKSAGIATSMTQCHPRPQVLAQEVGAADARSRSRLLAPPVAQLVDAVEPLALGEEVGDDQDPHSRRRGAARSSPRSAGRSPSRSRGRARRAAAGRDRASARAPG